MPVIEPGRRSPSWEKVRSRSRFSCSSWDRVGGIGTSITERIIYVQKPATKKNGLTFAISMSHTPCRSVRCKPLVRCDRLLRKVRVMHFEQRDAIALLAVPLIVAAFKAENAVFATLCLSLAAALAIFALARHDELPWKQRFALGALIFVADLATVFYLYRVNAARELREQAAPLVAAAQAQPVSSNC